MLEIRNREIHIETERQIYILREREINRQTQRQR